MDVQTDREKKKVTGFGSVCVCVCFWVGVWVCMCVSMNISEAPHWVVAAEHHQNEDTLLSRVGIGRVWTERGGGGGETERHRGEKESKISSRVWTRRSFSNPMHTKFHIIRKRLLAMTVNLVRFFKSVFAGNNNVKTNVSSKPASLTWQKIKKESIVFPLLAASCLFSICKAQRPPQQNQTSGQLEFLCQGNRSDGKLKPRRLRRGSLRGMTHLIVKTVYSIVSLWKCSYLYQHISTVASLGFFYLAVLWMLRRHLDTQIVLVSFV